jgi:hypothetical protein
MLIRLLMLAVQAPGAAAPAQPAPAAEAPAARAAVLDILRQSPLGPILAALERNFPDETAAMTDRLRREAVAARDIEAIAGVVPTALVTILPSKKEDISNAPAEDLLRVNRLQIDLYRAALAADADHCARSGGSAIDVPRTPDAVFPHLVRLSVAMVDAAGAGHRGPRIAGRGARNERYEQAWRAEMRALDGRLAALFANPGALRGASQEDQCRVRFLSYEAISRLDPEVGAAMAAALLAGNWEPAAAPRPGSAPD